MRASGNAVSALVNSTTTTVPSDTTALLRNARPMRAVRAAPNRTST